MNENNDRKIEYTLTIPEAGKRYFGLCRETSYLAAKRGEIPTIKIGNRYRVPIAVIERMINGDDITK